MCTSKITWEENEQQGLVFHYDYNAILSKYCTTVISKTYNISTKKPIKTVQANQVTTLLNKPLQLAKAKETNRAVVNNCNKIDINPKLAFPKWRHINHENEAIYIQKALAVRAKQDKRNQYAMTMRLSPSLAKKVMQKGAGYLQERLTTQLRRSLDFAPDMWLHLEATVTESHDSFQNGDYQIKRKKGSVSHTRGLLHMHGVVTLSRVDIPKMKHVVRSLNNSTDSVFHNHELDLTLLHDDIGWVDYCHKHNFINKILLGDTQRYSRSQILGKLAQTIYESDRKQNKMNGK